MVRSKKTGKMVRQPFTLQTFRFTSSDPSLLEPLAKEYGGTIKPWNEPRSPDTHEVTTEATKIKVVIPPDAISQSNELWDPHLKRTCNGPGGTCRLLVETQDDAEYQEVPCICGRKGIAECRYKLRLSVVLEETRSVGIWRWDSSSEIAGEEMPGVTDLIEELSARRGFNRGVLRLEQRAGRNKRYPVVVLDLDASIQELMAGTTRLGSLPVAPPVTAGELVAGGTGGDVAPHDAPPVPPSTDDDIVDAELVDEPARGVFPGAEDVPLETIEAREQALHDKYDDPKLVDDMEASAVIVGLFNAKMAQLPAKERNKIFARGAAIAQRRGEPVPMNINGLSAAVIEELEQGAGDEHSRATTDS